MQTPNERMLNDLLNKAKPKPEIILLHESVLGSWLKDFGTWAMTIGYFAPGIYFDSAALQWMGFVMAILVLFAQAGKNRNKYRMTIREARAKLNQIEGYNK